MYVEYSENLGYISDWLNHDCPLHVLQVRSPTPTESHRPTTSPLSSQDILSPTSDEVQFLCVGVPRAMLMSNLPHFSSFPYIHTLLHVVYSSVHMCLHVCHD